jgi:integrase
MASIGRRPNGKWRARYRDGDGREHARHFERKVDAQRWLDECTALIVTGRYADPRAGRVTLNAYYREWAPRQPWVAGTARAAGQAVASAPFGDLAIATVRRSHVQQWISEMTARGLAASTVRTRCAYVSGVFRAAMADRVIGENPLDGARLPRLTRGPAALRLPTAAQVGALIEHAPGEFAAFVSLAAFGGLRLGELIGLQVADVDFLRRTLTVTRQVQREGGTLDVRPPKYATTRQVSIPDRLCTVLAGVVGRRGPDAWIFPGDDGPVDHNVIRRSWATTRAAAGATGVRLHDLRHFYASGLIAAGCDVVTVQRALGHASASTTLGTYSHLWPSAEDRTRQAAAGLMASALDEKGGLADRLRTDRA